MFKMWSFNFSSCYFILFRRFEVSMQENTKISWFPGTLLINYYLFPHQESITCGTTRKDILTCEKLQLMSSRDVLTQFR